MALKFVGTGENWADSARGELGVDFCILGMELSEEKTGGLIVIADVI